MHAHTRSTTHITEMQRLAQPKLLQKKREKKKKNGADAVTETDELSSYSLRNNHKSDPTMYTLTKLYLAQSMEWCGLRAKASFGKGGKRS